MTKTYQKHNLSKKWTIYFHLLSLRIENGTTRRMYLFDFLKNGEKQTIITWLGLFSRTFQMPSILSPMNSQLPSSYGFDKNMICYFYSYLKSKKLCASVNNVECTFEEIISGVPQGSIVSPILFDIIFNEFFYFILVTSARNFADDNTLSSFPNKESNYYCGIRKWNSSKLV